MGSNEEITIYKTAIETALNSQFTDDYCIKVFEPIDANFNTPLIFVDRPEMEPVPNQPVRGQTYFNLKINIFVMFALDESDGGVKSVQLSAVLGNFIRDNSWGLKMAPAMLKNVGPAQIEGFEDYIIQCVSFEQRLVIKDNN